MTDASSSNVRTPLDFTKWLRSRGMNPSRRRPLGRQTVLWIEYRDYLTRTVGAEKAEVWFTKRAQPAEAAEKDPQAE